MRTIARRYPRIAAVLAMLAAATCGDGSGEGAAAPAPSASHSWHGVEPRNQPDRDTARQAERVRPQAPAPRRHQHFGPLGYGVGHANVIFAYSTDDELPVVYPGGVRPSDIAADLPQLAA